MGRLGLAEAIEQALAWQGRGGAAIVHVVEDHSTLGLDPSAKLVFGAQEEVAGEMHPGLSAALRDSVSQALSRRGSRVFSLNPSDSGGEVVGMQGGAVTVFVEVLAPETELIVVGAGHIAQPLAAIGDLLGFAVTVVDDRPEFACRERFPTARRLIVDEFVPGLSSIHIGPDSSVVLVTRGHVHDQSALRHVLRTDAGYIGMIGSRLRIRTVKQHLREEGFDDQQLGRVFAPIGLDINAHTPAEIAVAIAAEIVAVKRGASISHLTESKRTN